MKVHIDYRPYADETTDWSKRGTWPCKWVSCANAGEPPFVTAYRLLFRIEQARTVRAHVSADERYELFLDGARIGRGSERGDVDHWYFETYDLELDAGEHTLVARVWSVGEQAPYAQMTLRPGFLFSPEDDIELLGTGHAAWEVKRLAGYEFTPQLAAWGTGLRLHIHGDQFDWGWQVGGGGGWEPVKVDEEAKNDSANDNFPTRLLIPGALPAMMEEAGAFGKARHVSDSTAETHDVPIRAADNLPGEAAAWQALLTGAFERGRQAESSALTSLGGTPGSLAAPSPAATPRAGIVTVPAHSRRRVLIDLENYFCAYPELVTSGGKGASVRIHWQEALYNEKEAKTKGNRDETEGKYFATLWHLKDGVGDTYITDGGDGREFGSLWWHAGRYVEVLVTTQDEPVTIERLAFRETRYPVEMLGSFECSDDRLESIVPIMERVLQMCSHETYMDCPYYEQLQYVGDTRLQALVTYVITSDDRLARKALRMFDISRLVEGITYSRYPSRIRQIIPPFSLWWIGMVHDYALWRDDLPFVRSLMPGIRAVLDRFGDWIDSDGLAQGPDGWNFMDWVEEWRAGIPADGDSGVSGIVNLLLALALRYAADLEGWIGEPELAARHARRADELMEAIDRRFWDEKRGLYADDLAHVHWSEHAQCLAVLGGSLSAARRAQIAKGLQGDPDLARTTIYFTHYLFEAYRELGLADLLFERLEMWFDHVKNGLKTTIEHPEPTRSDCHAWGAHPLFHYYATILGVRPAAAGFRQVSVRPMLGPLKWAKGRFPHPLGEIEIEASGSGAQVRLPEGVTQI